MVSKKKLLQGCRLYLILDASVCNYDRLFGILKSAVLSGVDIVQLRDKVGSAKDIGWFCQKALSLLKGRIPFIVNDRVDIALLSGACGVHLGQDDISPVAARRILGPRAIIGVSCQNMAHLRRAYREGADYVGFGSVFQTLTKPGREPMPPGLLVKSAFYADQKKLPLFAIGGITRDNLAEVKSRGVRRVAVCRDILLAEDIRRTVGGFCAALKA
ncbi:MAG: thiamine phosphate synthase [Candidatus Omnitrophica bacterium]|nr:thiamine phosphate synthase [Candidatus Omnitrophota bacterium]